MLDTCMYEALQHISEKLEGFSNIIEASSYTRDCSGTCKMHLELPRIGRCASESPITGV